MTYFLVTVTDGQLCIASDVPADHAATPPWRVVDANELAMLREQYGEVPQSVTARQIRLWLIRHGYTLAQVEQAIDGIPDTVTRESVRVEWEYAPYIERGHPMLGPLATALGMDDLAVNAAFREAATI